MTSEIRVNKINNRAGLGTITIADTGVVVNGIVTCTEVSGLNVLNIAGVSTFASTLDINGDIDVDGHTNLDNVSVAGVTTFTGNIQVGTGITIGTAGVGTFTSVHAIDSFACQKYPTTKISFPTNDNHLQIFTSNTQRMRFYAAGTIFIGEESQGPSGNAGLYLNRSSTSVFSDSSRLYDQPNYAMVHIKNYNATGGGEAGIVLHNDNGAAGVVAIYGKKRSNYISDCIFRFRDAGNTSVESFRVRTTDIQVGTGVTIETNGQATFVGIVTFGSSSTTINGNTDTVNVGTALTIGHSQGLQYHTQNLHAQGFEVNQINASGIITATELDISGDIDVDGHTNLDNVSIAGVVTATTYYGDGSNLSNITSTTINNNADNRVITGSGTANTLNGESSLTYNGSSLKIGDTSFSNVNTGAENLIIGTESSGSNRGLSIITHSANTGHLFFGDQDNGTMGGFRYQNGADVLQGYSGGSAPFYLKSNALGLHENYPEAHSITIRGASQNDIPSLVIRKHTDGDTNHDEEIGRIKFKSNDNNVDSGNSVSRIELRAVHVNAAGAAKLEFYTVPNFTTNPVKTMTLNQEGRLCIGTDDAVAKLNVVHSSSDTTATGSGTLASCISVSNTNTTNNNFAGIVFGDRTDSQDFIGGIFTQITDHTQNYGNLVFYTNGSGGRTEKLRITSNGNVLIGDGATYTPGCHVHLHGGTSGLQQLRVQNHTSIGSFSGNYGSEFRHAYSSANHCMLIHTQEAATSRRTLDISDSNGVFASFTNHKMGLGTGITSPNGTLEIRTTNDDDAIRLVNSGSSIGDNGIQWWNEYGGLTKRVSMDYGESDANFDIKLFRGDAQDDRPYGNVRIFTGDYSNPNMNFRVTTLGTVHQPNQPAFLVRDSVSSSAFGANSYADFDTVILNRGNHYNTSNGRFTAPIAGTYLFLSLMLSNGSSRLFHEIRKNGSRIEGTRTESGTNAGQYQSNTTQAIVELAKGDWVAIHVGSGGAYGSAFSNFSGYLLG